MNKITTLDDRLIGRYDFFIVDQWGVMHNGQYGFEAAMAALARIVAAGKIVVTLSNSSRIREVTRDNLARLGYSQNIHYHEIVTSGSDVVWCFRERPDLFYRNIKGCCYVFGYGQERDLIEYMQLEETADIKRADFIICMGLTGGRRVDSYDRELAIGCRRRLPMICVNPDEWTLKPDNTLHPCPGAIAKRYEALGGQVRWHGKPRREAYDSCFALLDRNHRINHKHARGLAIGDSLQHDIAGGANAGLDTLLIASGIHRYELGSDQSPDNPVFSYFNVTPTYLMQQLQT